MSTEITSNNIIWTSPEITRSTVGDATLGTVSTIGTNCPSWIWPNEQIFYYHSPQPPLFKVVHNDLEVQVIQIDIPGAKREEIDLKVVHGNLNLTTNGKRHYNSTHFLGFTFHSVFAHLEDGVLTLSFQKTGVQTIPIEISRP